MIDSNAQGFYEVTATAKDSIKHTKFVRNTLLTVGVSTRILKWSIANESFFYDILSQLFEFSFDFDGDGEISIDELMIGDWMIDFGRKYILKFLTKTSNFCINEYLKTISATTFYLVIPAPSKESIKSVSSVSILPTLPTDLSKEIKPEKVSSISKKDQLSCHDLYKFFSENESKKGTLVEFSFKKNILEVGVECSSFSIAEEFELQQHQNQEGIDAVIFVKTESVNHVLTSLKDLKDISFKQKDDLLFLQESISLKIERSVPNRQRQSPIVVVFKDTSILSFFAEICSQGSKKAPPVCPYLQCTVSRAGFDVSVLHKMMAFEYVYHPSLLNEWGSSIPSGEPFTSTFFLPAEAIKKISRRESPLKIHLNVGGVVTLKTGTTSLKLNKDSSVEFSLFPFYDKQGGFSITFAEGKESSEPYRTKKMIEWLNQTKATACDLLIGPDGMWIAPLGCLAKQQDIKAVALKIDDLNLGMSKNLVASFSSSVINAIKVMGLKDVTIFFPEKKGEILCIEADNAAILAQATFTEIPIAEVAEIPALIDETPIAVEQGTETLVEVPTTTGEAIKQAIIENKVPEEIQETVEKALKQMEAVNTIVPSKPAELAEAQKAIIETAIVEAIDPENVLNLDPQTKKKAKAVKEAVEDTKAKLETEIQSESIDLNRIIALTIKLETLGGRFIEITFALQTKWYPTLTITEEVMAEARKQYPHLAQ